MQISCDNTASGIFPLQVHRSDRRLERFLDNRSSYRRDICVYLQVLSVKTKRNTITYLAIPRRLQKDVDILPKKCYNIVVRRCGGIGRHKGLKIPRGKTRTGSSPVSGTNERMSILRHSFLIF